MKSERPFDQEQVRKSLTGAHITKETVSKYAQAKEDFLKEDGLGLVERIAAHGVHLWLHYARWVLEFKEKKARAELEEQVNYLKEKMDVLSSDLENAMEAYVSGADTPEAQSLKERLDESENRLKAFLQTEGFYEFSEEYIRARENKLRQGAVEGLMQFLPETAYSELTPNETEYLRLLRNAENLEAYSLLVENVTRNANPEKVDRSGITKTHNDAVFAQQALETFVREHPGIEEAVSKKGRPIR